MPDAPKPAVGYIVVNSDWSLPPRTPQSWILALPQMFVGLKDAEVQRSGLRAMAPEGSDKVILEATIMFRVVGGGGHA